MLADLLTIREHLGRIQGVKLVYMGDARYNMGNSYMVACAKMGMHFTACAPKEYFPDSELAEQCRAIAAQTGGSITLTEDAAEGTKDADVICTDVWVSMGEPDYVWEERIRLLSPYQETAKLWKMREMPSLCTVSLHSMTCIPGLGRKSEKNSESMKWKYPMRCLSPRLPLCLMRRKTGCIRSKRSWRLLWAMNSETGTGKGVLTIS